MFRTGGASFMKFSNGVLDFTEGKEDCFMVDIGRVVVEEGIVNECFVGEGIVRKFKLIVYGIDK